MANERLQYMVWVKSLKVMASPADWYLIEQSGCLSSHGPMRGVKRVDEEDHIVLLSTGLKDSNDKLFFAGSILDFTVFDQFDNDKQYRGCIVYSGSRFMIWKSPDDEFYGDDGGFDLDWVCNQDMDIENIGNIYENPELINNEKKEQSCTFKN